MHLHGESMVTVVVVVVVLVLLPWSMRDLGCSSRPACTQQACSRPARRYTHTRMLLTAGCYGRQASGKGPAVEPWVVPRQWVRAPTRSCCRCAAVKAHAVHGLCVKGSAPQRPKSCVRLSCCFVQVPFKE